MHQLTEEKDNLTSKIQQGAAHCNTMQTEHVSAKHILLLNLYTVAMVTVVTASS